MAQPIIRGVQAVGAVSIRYFYNGQGGALARPLGWDGGPKVVDTRQGVTVAGFRLDSEFLRATQQIATSAMIPLLGGGGLALTNNNRSGTLEVNCSKVSYPETSTGAMMTIPNRTGMTSTSAVGPTGTSEPVYDMVLLAQYQQCTAGGDDVGSTIEVGFQFNGKTTTLIFECCTVANVAPLALAGNDASNYNISWNYLNWFCSFADTAG